MLGKRPSLQKQESGQIGTKRVKMADGPSGSDQKKGELEEEKQPNGEPAKRSARNVGKVANYNIDEIIEASL
jgi:hypothetical protein